MADNKNNTKDTSTPAPIVPPGQAKKDTTANKEQMNNNQNNSVDNAQHANDQSSTLVNVNQ